MNIKIRAWDKSREKMLYSPESYFTISFNKNEHLVGENYDLYGDEQDLEIMLATGLLDQNLTEIYEGDVISDGHFKWVVEYQIDRFIGRLVSHYNSKISEIRLSKLLRSREMANMPISVTGNIYKGDSIYIHHHTDYNEVNKILEEYRNDKS